MKIKNLRIGIFLGAGKLIMVKNYFKTAWRNLKKNKGFFGLNFFGLYISVLACLLIGLIILHETSFDLPGGNGVSIYRVVNHFGTSTGKSFTGVTPYPLASAMRAMMPENRLISQIHFERDISVTIGEKTLKERNIVFADSVFPRLFPPTLIEGSLQRALAEPGFVILTEKTARRFFGKEDPIGKRIKQQNVDALTIAAVVADPPANSHLQYSMLISYLSLNPSFIGGLTLDQWSVNASGFTYIGLTGDNKVKHTETMLASLTAKYIHATKPDFTDLKLQPLQDIHFNQLYAANNPSYTINYRYLYLMGLIGLFLIIAACINYTNLSTALAIKKSKEVGVRKTMGATRGHLINQFLSETFLLTAFVLVAAALSVRPILPSLNGFLDKNIPLAWLNLTSGLLLLGLWVAVSLLSGVYPAFVLSGFNPITALKNKMATPKTSVVVLRRGLVIFQFLTAQVLMTSAIVVAKQMSFMQSAPLGFNRENVLDITLPENRPEQLQSLHDRLSAIPGISHFSLSLGAPISDNQINTEFNRKEKFGTEKLDVAVKAADRDYITTYGLQLAAGRWFDENDERRVASAIPDSLRRYAFVLNETAVTSLGFHSPQDAIGKYVTFGFNNISAPVIGVMKDYHIASLHKAVAPVLMVQFPYFYYNAGIKFYGAPTPSVLSAIEKVYKSIFPNQVFELNFLDEHVAALYKEETRTRQLFNIFTFLSAVINILGLVGLLSFMIEQKTKEIGIRKVLGATVKDISFHLSKDFLRLILVAFLIAAPVALFIMNKWLQQFAYRTTISWWVFAVTITGGLVITCLAIGFQTIKAAFANPVKSMRSE
jgi:putative ABC transport system permease protein